MRVAIPILISVLLLACKTPRLAERLPGRWRIEHYEEYDVRRELGSGHTLDNCGYLEFRKGRLNRQLAAGAPHGTLSTLRDATIVMEDSVFVVQDPGRALPERWLLTKDLTDYMEWVRVSEDRDSVFTMYLYK